MRKAPLFLLVPGGLLGALAFPAQALVLDWSDPAPFTIPGSGTQGLASPPSTAISVSGVTGTVTEVTASLFGLSHQRADDLDILLVGPTGEKVLLMSDSIGNRPLSGINLTFDDSAPSGLPNSLPANTVFSGGTYQPSDWQPSESLQDFGLSGSPWGLLLSAFDNLDPNGDWALYIRDDGNHNTGSLSGGWSLSITTGDATIGPAGTLPPNAVPEPATFALLGLGWAGMGFLRRKA